MKKKAPVETKKTELYGLDLDFLKSINLGDDAEFILNERWKLAEESMIERPYSAISALDGKLGKTTKLREICDEFRKDC